MESQALRGRATAVVFITTFDLPSQALAKRVDEVLRRQRPRANAVAVVLEAPKYADLAIAFRESLELSYPVAMADVATLRGGGAFKDVATVPVLVVLDHAGRLIARFDGGAPPEDIERALSRGSR